MSFPGWSEFCRDTTCRDLSRPQRATKSATRPLPDDPDLAAVVTAWPDLPEVIRAGIMAMIKASDRPQGSAV